MPVEVKTLYLIASLIFLFLFSWVGLRILEEGVVVPVCNAVVAGRGGGVCVMEAMALCSW
ncbi:hypothetical protein L873DRAFT_382624 [Choiromyces venosus 120613-1]|uniref:Uncharacterized protein n=1 Tax=Choiromyces venosus 120613-1 TaxID=1336337 RepID=A0A3N4IX67_9PEZI|nr:hypothetical protein L873DRAFT_382624 [Choiromyces venosus 120613-1]